MALQPADPSVSHNEGARALSTKHTVYLAFGLDRDGKPRAATIPPDDLSVATKAAATMGLKIGRAETPDALKLTKTLPEVRIFATGKGLVPLVKKAVFEALTKTVVIVEAAAKSGNNDMAVPSKAAEPTPQKATAPNVEIDPWTKLTPGDEVVAPDKEPLENGYWLARILSISKDGSKLTLRWVDSKLPPFTARRHSVAILRPKQ